MLEKTKHTWFPTQKNTSKTYVTDSRNVLPSCARGKVNRFCHSHKNLSLSLSLYLYLYLSQPLNQQTHTHTHTHRHWCAQAYTHIHLNNIWPLKSQHNNIWSHQIWISTHPYPNTHPCKNVPPLIRSYFSTNQTGIAYQRYTLTVTWAELLINPHQHNVPIQFWQVCVCVFGGKGLGKGGGGGGGI